MNSIPNPQFTHSLCHLAKSTVPAPIRARFSRAKLAALSMCLAGAASLPALAQTTNVYSVYNVTGATVAAPVNNMAPSATTTEKVRFTVPVNQTGNVATTIRITLGAGQTTLTSSTTNFVDPDYYITNYYDLNAGVATLAATGVPATGGGAAAVLGVQSITNTSGGNSTFDVTVALNYTNLTSGDYDMAIQAVGANTWRYPLPVKAGYMWSGGGGAGNIAFSSPANWVGGVVPGPNDIVIVDTNGAASSSSTPTIGITSDTTIGSVSDIHTGDNYTHWNIGAGATLSILGDDGFRQLIDIIEGNDRSRIRASGAGTMVISNANAEFNLITTRQNNSFDNADFSALNTLIVDVKKITFNDIAAYPNFRTNGVSNRPRRNVYDMDWALTNIIRATLTDPNGWTNDTRNYSLAINRESTGGQTGNDGGMHFGLWNEMDCDSILFGGYSQMENPQVDFRTSGSYLKIRNADGVSRVSNLTIADAIDYYSTGSANNGATKVNVSFTTGAVDALIDTLFIGRNPRITANGPATGKLFLGAGTFDVNNAFLGYQTGSVDGTENGYAYGRVDVGSNCVFRVNDTLVLGYTETNTSTVTGGGGEFNILAGGTADINLLTVGGPKNASTGNKITITGGTLSISNTVGSSAAPVPSLSLSDSTLIFHVNGANTDPYLYAATLTIGGSANTIRIASVTGVSTYPRTVPLISYSGSVAPNFTLELPAGLYGYIVNNTANSTIDAVITTSAPKTVVWNGTPSGDWDTSSANWQGGQTFNNGDQATFDDSAAGTKSVNVVGTVTPGPGGILVSNDVNPYSFSGGTISGTAPMTKKGANLLTIDVTSEVPLTIESGSVMGSGTIGFTTVGAGSTLDYMGTINGLASSGSTTNAGTVNIGASIMGGMFVNSSTVNGTFSMSGGVTENTGTIEATGNSSVGSGTTLIHDGHFNNHSGRISISGTLTGSGTVTDMTGDVNENTGRLEINGGGVFTPGGANTIGTFTIEARFDLNAATPDGQMIIDVNMNDPAINDVIKVDKWSNFRGALVMNNIGPVPFAAGQSFKIFTQNFGQPNTPEAAFDLANKITPKVPGVGLQWDVSDLKTNGIISVISAPLTMPELTNTVVGGTNLSLSWPTTHLGYQLQVQTNSLTTGLGTNWVPVEGSEQTNSWNITIDPAAPSVFYRLSNQ